jgi:hypothetical protein
MSLLALCVVNLSNMTYLPDGENGHLKFRLRQQTREENKHFKRPVLQAIDKRRSINLGTEYNSIINNIEYNIIHKFIPNGDCLKNLNTQK